MTSQKQLFNSVKPLRVTVPLSPEVHDAFVKVAAAQGVSVGRAMGDWLRDTSDAALQMASMVSDIKTKPFEVALRLSGYASAMSDVSTGLVERIRKQSKVGGAERGPDTGKAPRSRSAQKVAGKVLPPPVSNTGGKVSEARKPKGSK